MQEKIEIPVLSFVLDIQDFRSYSPQGESWGGYSPRVVDTNIEVYFDLVQYNGKEYLL